MALERIGSLEIDEDYAYQKRAWVRQRIGWVALLLFLIAALLGLLGGQGPLNKATAGAAGNELQAGYDRFLRVERPATLHLFLGDLSGAGTVQVALDGNFLRMVEVDRIAPEPVRQTAAGNEVIYDFAVAQGAPRVEVRFDFTPERVGPLRCPVRKVDGPAIRIRSFVYP